MKRENILEETTFILIKLIPNTYITDHNLKDSLDHMLFCDCKIWLPDNLLDRGDKMTMGASIEGRVPFLDHELIEYAFNLPSSVKVKGMTRKWIIKKIASKYLPKIIVNRKKAGFVVPLNQWFKGKLKDLCYNSIIDSNNITTTLLSKKICTNILDAHSSGKKDYSLQIWSLLGLSIWFNACVKNIK